MQISVITAVYNRVDTIETALTSIERQTYGNIDHIIIDGGSDDGTLDVINAQDRPGLRLISEPDNGIYDAINKGIKLSIGEVIGLVHSDDILANETVLAKVAAAFADPSVDAVYGDLEYVSGSDPDKVIRRWRAGEFQPAKLRRGWMPPHPALFVRRSFMERHDIYNTSYRIAADYDAILRWFGQKGIRTVYIPEVLVQMRLGGESNRSLGRILLKSSEDYRALRTNGVGGLGALMFKNLSKIPQFF